MNNHRAAIESAAKACGIEGTWDDSSNCFVPATGQIFWNPLTSSADCAAMCAKLMIDTCWYADRVVCSFAEHYSEYNTQFDGHEISWRFAATQVAALIGEEK